MQNEPAAQPKPLFTFVGYPPTSPDDLTIRGLRAVAAADLVVTRDPKEAAQLLRHHNINAKIMAVDEADDIVADIIHHIQAGRQVVYLAEGAYPNASDPWPSISAGLAEHDIRPRILPGVGVVVASLLAGGFSLEGYDVVPQLPRRPDERRLAAEALARRRHTIAIVESPLRLRSLLAVLVETMPDRAGAVVVNVSTGSEGIVRGTFRELFERLSASRLRGEVVVVVAPDERRDEYEPIEMPGEELDEPSVRERGPMWSAPERRDRSRQQQPFSWGHRRGSGERREQPGMRRRPDGFRLQGWGEERRRGGDRGERMGSRGRGPRHPDDVERSQSGEHGRSHGERRGSQHGTKSASVYQGRHGTGGRAEGWDRSEGRGSFHDKPKGGQYRGSRDREHDGRQGSDDRRRQRFGQSRDRFGDGRFGRTRGDDPRPGGRHGDGQDGTRQSVERPRANRGFERPRRGPGASHASTFKRQGFGSGRPREGRPPARTRAGRQKGAGPQFGTKGRRGH